MVAGWGGAGEVAWWVRAFIAFAEDLDLVPSKHTGLVTNRDLRFQGILRSPEVPPYVNLFGHMEE